MSSIAATLPDSAGPGAAPSPRATILAGLIGNVMEWYDFAVYGYFATVIGALFFPNADPAVSVIAAFGAFAAGFLVRPLGGLLFGRIGDLVGRRRALTLSVVCMALPTVAIAFLPTYQTIGVAAPVLIVLLRILQGLSVGGEYTGSIVFLAEKAPHGRRALYASWSMWGAVAGILLGSAVGAIMTNVLDEAAILAWGWRLPFALGALVALSGWFLRRGIAAEAPPPEAKAPLRDTFGRHRLQVLRVALLNLVNGVGFYATFVYSVTYMKQIDRLPGRIAFDLNTANMALLLLLIPLAALAADRFGRKPLIVAGAAAFAFGAVPLFHLIHSGDDGLVLLGEAGLALAMGLFGGGMVIANVELIPKAVRCTGLAFAYNAAIGLFGGTTPMVVAWLVTSTGNPIAPGWYVAAAGAVSLLAALFLLPETKHQPLA
ncbi:MFS transporter, MHS family, proline/betaine transporter [Tistlia consotensis]|uniref:MFS transporter, MHS family, proline/betaine transporter n=1 Tax=Tistlia consotensis USBA 355 TaxID=560819 RepID=A0A1Y6C556_9PROT|nr:MFS transporter [Tistlia consotensis]SMF43698.1 MFS transporter, MHS family, proline/betaine transporter [Tistlia consotensis USBA 355]SNR42840.1 MFS transporter, MHS family, proline/betaine transporter [Tistlia consotensis]